MKTHLNLRANNLPQSVEFYTTLLNVAPVKRYDDYALFISNDPGMELALDADLDALVTDSGHYGIVVDSASDVDAAIARLQKAGLATAIEREETCCYAVQTKVWATDPDGRRWEIYTVLDDVEERDGESPVACSTSTAADAGATSCCTA